LALFGCGDTERTAGGSSYETENAVQARVLLPDGSPARAAQVRARPLGWLAGDSTNSRIDTVADSAGRLSLILPSGAWRIEARLAGTVAVLDVPSRRTPGLVRDIRLDAPTAVAGRATPGAWVGVSGLQHRVLADPRGSFFLDSLPAGVHVLHQIGSTARAFASTEAGRTTNAGPLLSETSGEILLDDFEDGDALLRHAPWTGGGTWRVDADSAVNLSPDGLSSQPERAIFDDGNGGKVLHVSAAFPDNAPAAIRARCGLAFATRAIDLSTLASVRFRTRGIGTTEVQLLLDSGATPYLQATVVLDSVWRVVDVPVANFQPPAGSGPTLDAAARSLLLRRATGLRWTLQPTIGDLWLDDVRLVGPSTSVLWGETPPP